MGHMYMCNMHKISNGYENWESMNSKEEVIKNATQCLLCCIFLCTYYIGMKHNNLILFLKKF